MPEIVYKLQPAFSNYYNIAINLQFSINTKVLWEAHQKVIKTCSVSCRTSEKLQTACKSSSMADHSNRCLLCICALDTAVGECCMEQKQ